MNDKTPRYFISYSRADSGFVKRLIKDLQDKDIDAWWDQMDIPAGVPWDSRIEYLVENCSAVIVPLSKSSVASKAVADEWSWGLNFNKPIITLKLEDCKVPMRLQRLNWIDFTINYADGFKKLLEALHEMRDNPEPRSGPKPHQKPPVQGPGKGLSIAMGVVALAVAYLLYEWFRDVPIVQVTSDPSNSTVYANGELFGRTPVDIDGFSAGEEVSVSVEADGYVTFQEVIEFPDSGILTLDAALITLQEANFEPKIPDMVTINPGSFVMGPAERGNTDEERFNHVTLDYSFDMGKYEVSYEEWDSCVEAGACRHVPNTDRGRALLPVAQVNWDDSQDYVEWLSEVTGDHWRLPSEAEWEYAARAGTTTRYSWGDEPPVCAEDFPNGANFDECTEDETFTVKSFQPNPWGLHHVHGNVWEWVEDCVHPNYAGAPGNGDPWLDENDGNCEKRVLRSGALDVEGLYINSAHRNISNVIETTYPTIGFRVVRE